MVDIEISNQSREDDIYIKYLTINSSSGFTHNILDGLDDDGALILRLDNGETQRIRAGEVHLQ